MTRLLLADATPLNDIAVYSELYGNASLERRARADSYRFQKDRNLSIAAAALLDIGLASFGLREKDMAYGRTAEGQPLFINAPHIHFSISHSENKVAVAFSDGDVGCDIELMSDIGMDVAERFFCRQEYEEIIALQGAEERIRAFYRCWTLKESYMKAKGKGMGLPPDSFRISGGTVFGNVPDSGFVFLSPDSFAGYECALCCRPDSGTPKIEIVSVSATACAVPRMPQRQRPPHSENPHCAS